MIVRKRSVLFVIGFVLSALFTLSSAVMAQDAPAGIPVVTGLNGPMGVLIDPTGDLWVAEAGLGGDGSLTVNSPEGGVVTGTIGTSARIVKVNMGDGVSTTVASLVSIDMAGESSGVNRLALMDGKLYASAGGWDAGMDPSVDAPAGVARINEIGADGTVQEVFDSWAFEKANNPAGGIYDAHPYGLMGGDDGRLWVTDAAANTLMRVDPATGKGEVVTVFDPLPGVFPRPEYNNQMLTDPVPTGVATKDGATYVSLLSGAPFVPGSAKVVRVAEDGTVSDYATGLTMLTDLRTGPDGELYATSFGLFGEQGPTPNTGALVRIGEGDTSLALVSGLPFATSLDFDAAGNAYVSINGVGAPGSGEVLKFENASKMVGRPYSELLAEFAAAQPPPPAATDAMSETASMTATQSAESTAVITSTAATVPAEAVPAAPATLPVTGSASTPTASPLVAGLVLALLVLVIYMAIMRTA